jgi:predicted  nucleic acid-binding Zn-ribbon protein
MMGKKLDTEMKKVPVVRDFRAEVDKVLREKIDSVIKGFQDERKKGFVELAALDQSLEDLKSKRAVLVTEKNGLITSIMGYGAKGVANLDQRINWLSKQIKSLEDQIEKLFSRLTEIPKFDFSFLNFLTKGGRDESI